MHKGDKRLDSSPTERNLEVWIDGKLNMSQQKGSAVSWGAFAFKHSITSYLRKVTALLCNTLMQPQLRPCVQFWVPLYQKDIELKDMDCVWGRQPRWCEVPRAKGAS